MNTELQKLIEEIDEVEDAQGDVTNFQPPTKEEWEFADEDLLFGESFGIDMSADLILDNEPHYAAIFFTRLGEVMQTADGDNARKTIIAALHRVTREVSEEIQVGTDLVMKPESDLTVVASLKYLFDNLIKYLMKDLKHAK